MNKTVYIVHCIDTEGPLYESLEATFKMIYDIYGIDIEPSYENIRRIQKREIHFSGNEEAIAKLVDSSRLNYLDSWFKIDQLLDDITTNEFRNELLDSFGNGWIYNWFCVDHVGFTGDNPRRKDLGFHKVFDHYERYNKLNNIQQDMIQWHFHPIPIKKEAQLNANTYLNSNIIFEILARKIIDRNWFPSAIRPNVERPDANWFLEQWIPFDYGNRSMIRQSTDQPDLGEGRFGDWRIAPTEWTVYHPDHDDYQKEGNCRRWIARSLNVEARLCEINIEDFRVGFKRAQSDKPTLICFNNHDFRDMKSEINNMRKMIEIVSKEFPDVKFKFSNALEGIRSVSGLKKFWNPDFSVELERRENLSKFKVKAKNDIFGPQPFLAIKTKTGQYIWENFDFQGKNQWCYTFDFYTLDIDVVEKIGIAANTENGVSEIVVLDVTKNKITKNILNLE